MDSDQKPKCQKVTPDSTEQPDQEMPSQSSDETEKITHNSAVQPIPLRPQLRMLVGDCPLVPQFEVAFSAGNWWSIPNPINTLLYEEYAKGNNAGYTWDWGEARRGSWKPDGENTFINRYEIDFEAMVQRNMDNDRRRSMRLIWVRSQDVTAWCTGQKPTTRQMTDNAKQSDLLASP